MSTASPAPPSSQSGSPAPNPVMAARLPARPHSPRLTESHTSRPPPQPPSLRLQPRGWRDRPGTAQCRCRQTGRDAEASAASLTSSHFSLRSFCYGFQNPMARSRKQVQQLTPLAGDSDFLHQEGRDACGVTWFGVLCLVPPGHPRPHMAQQVLSPSLRPSTACQSLPLCHLLESPNTEHQVPKGQGDLFEKRVTGQGHTGH